MLKFYEYRGCSTCQKASKFLDAHKVKFEPIAIVGTPPTLGELKKMVGFLKSKGKPFTALFNTSGLLYRELKISAKLAGGLTEGEALKLLAANGKLIKRPFVIGVDFGTVGFKETDWNELFKS